MKLIRYVVAYVASVALTGCGAFDDGAGNGSLAVESPATSPKLKGKWKAEIDSGAKNSSDPAAALAKGMEQMFSAMIELEFTDESRFRMSMIGIPVEGRVERTGNSFELYAESVAGMSKDELAKEGQAKASDFEKPMRGSISEDGEKITLHGEELGKETMTFTRKPNEKAEPMSSASSTVTSEEAALVGAWKGKMTLPRADESERKMMEAMMSNIRLELRRDNTFSLELMFSMKGTWRASAGQLELLPTEAMGMSSKASQKPMRVLIGADGRTLKAVPESAAEKEELTFTKIS